jgi:hypothetical protein
MLMHSAVTISRFMLPIGIYSEEALEARNKQNRNFRLEHKRKRNRKETLEDLFNLYPSMMATVASK